ncbi:hypothetical protein EDB81DRAFT_39793 [Dactylonectria macrodidyma]|uniref:C2H2-type domain-containing protein n=1 Tax=Dactylonectria macrodidyma TaxID=307937 RepID=A0A9P9FUI6_9HYPO|nr:hypothetical protein EDB81DRAFT_39793 [Dactylonectria macrodidyma]
MEGLRRSSWRRSDVMEAIAPRRVLAKRHLENGAIAGIVVGACVGVALLLVCLYPVLIRQIIRRRRERRMQNALPDAETGEVSVPTGSAGTDGPTQRLSSQDSFKPGEELSRGDIGGGSVKDGWTPNDAVARSGSQEQSRSVQIDSDVPPRQVAMPVRSDTQGTTLTGFEEEFMPQEIGDAHDGVLNGTSADYYSPAVPSEAFGMVIEEPQPQPDTKRSLSRGSSLRHNLKQMFSRKSTRDYSMHSPTSPTFGGSFDVGTRAPLSDGPPLERITTNEVTSESPTDIYPPASDMLPPPRALGSPISLPNKPSDEPPPGAVQTPPQSPPIDAKFRASASPPTNPAPGTVNPMDIMPATTESEMWHRTEHQLYMTYNPSSSPSPLPSSNPSPPEVPTDSPSPLTLPPNIPLAIPIIQSPTPTQREVSFKRDPADDQDINMVDIPTHIHLTPAPDRDTRHPSYPSDASTPLPGPTSTNPSTLNTPATQLDTPSPHSEYVNSVSPANGHSSIVYTDYNAMPSTNVDASITYPVTPNSGDGGATLSPPKTGTYPCDEPNCRQVFDQPHKLKHHQRYHTKEHKCTYPGCGKGFGTKTHLQRHINDRHEKKKKFHCAVQGCDYSRQGGKGFPRKDNWKRHMTKIHNMDQRFLPEPVEADTEMGGI